MSPLANCPVPNATVLGQPEGTGANGVLILGEALGDSEAHDHGLPFRPFAPAGSVLERAIRRCGYSRQQFVLYNAVPTQPPKNHLAGAPYEDEAIAWGRPLLEDVINHFQPRCILALGGIPLKATTKQCGESRGISHLRGWVLRSHWGIPVVGSFHPSFLRRGAMALFSVLMHDIKLAVAVASLWRPMTTPLDLEHPAAAAAHNSGSGTPPPTGNLRASGGGLDALGKGGFPQQKTATFFSPVLWRDFTFSLPAIRDISEPVVPAGYITHATEMDAYESLRDAKAHPELPIAYDIETPRSAVSTEDETDELEDVEILSIQFSLRPRTGIFLPWRDPFVEVAKAVLALPNMKVGANTWRFDDPLLEAHHCRLYGERHDVRWAWHHLQPDLRAGLQFIASFYALEMGPWKHLHASHPEYYGIADVDALQRIVIG